MKSNYLLLVSDNEYDYKKSIEYSFNKKNIETIKSDHLSNEEVEKLAKKINSKYKKIILFDHNYNFLMLLPLVKSGVEVDWIFKSTIPYLFNKYIYNSLFQIIEYKERGLISNIYCLDYNLYSVFKDKYDFKYLQLNYSNRKNLNSDFNNSVGIIGKDYDSGANFFNSLSALTMHSFDQIKVENMMNVTSQFGHDFKLNIVKCSDFADVISNNVLNICSSVSDIKTTLILESFENGVPCILGNTDLFDSNEYLKKSLVLNSDDSIDEISDKISYVVENRDKILSEYKKFKKEYDSKFKESISLLLK
ncbi:MAG: hypothetical protein E7160_03910 [Firmicutes bacterium]|nr:hypothetical protein [Bacillota bacterium]